jgi:high affinity sulfate transporter 1
MSTRTAPNETGVLQRYLPILQWLPRYDRTWLSADIVAGITVWALLVPQSIAYASVAGMPAQYGLYAAIGALIGATLFSTSRQLVVGPSATVAAVSASAIASMAATGSSEWIAYSAALALIAGLIYVVLGVARMGWISNFLSAAVLGGFIFGFGIGLIIDQSHKILGVPKTEGSYVEVLIGTVRDLPDTSGWTFAIGTAAIALLLAMRRFVPAWPRALVVVLLGIIASSALNVASHGVSTVGDVPTGLPSFGFPDFSGADIGRLFIGGLAVIFVGFSETLAAARNEASKHGYEIDTSQEMVAQGMANGASGLLGGFAVTGSLSKTTVADLANQRSQLASLSNAVLVLVTAIFFADIFADLPQAILGAVVIDAALGLIKVEELQRIRTTSRTDFATYLAAMVGLLFIGVLPGVLIGVVLSLLLLIAAASRSPVQRLAFDATENVYVAADTHPDASTVPGVFVARIEGPLFFADAGNFRRAILDMVETEGAYAVVIDLEAAAMIDLEGADILTRLNDELRRRDVTVALARLDDDHLDLLRKAGTLAAIGEHNVFLSARHAVATVVRSRTPVVSANIDQSLVATDGSVRRTSVDGTG